MFCRTTSIQGHISCQGVSSEPNSQTMRSPKGRGLRAMRTQTGHPGDRSPLQIGTPLFLELFDPQRLSFHSFVINSCYVSPRSAPCFSPVGHHPQSDFIRHEFSLGSPPLAGEAGRGEGRPGGGGGCGGRGPAALCTHTCVGQGFLVTGRDAPCRVFWN